MDITFNGKVLTLAEGTTVADLIKQKGLKPETIIVEYNFELLTRENWQGITLKENDTLEVLRFVGGG